MSPGGSNPSPSASTERSFERRKLPMSRPRQRVAWQIALDPMCRRRPPRPRRAGRATVLAPVVSDAPFFRHDSPHITGGKHRQTAAHSSVDSAGGAGPVPALSGRARSIRSRSPQVRRFPQLAAPLQIQREIGAVAEHAGKDECGWGGYAAAVVAQFIDVLALHAHRFGQRALRQAHRLHEFFGQNFANTGRFAIRRQHGSPRRWRWLSEESPCHGALA